ncbi:elongation of very long chain fatty acids protein 7 [Episyrphus balteatus]|uniref:elongation of very long chain fatty acids protein 7 n=1 Tax=Episyrphus balteatus TaxID=286459 RepID=UPI002484D934|nr:elongation of very long chain fatty acids protein 7 [Episyrphus balteatus]XP_055848574.1 elongation of very long chain fatty acids protein 7 [Episyrphus balteatus]
MTSFIRIFNDRIADLSNGVDKTIDNWLLMSSPLPLLTLLGAYLTFVLKVGPAFMANRKPYNLQKAMVVYNAFQVVFSTWLCYTSLQESSIVSHLMEKKCEVHRDRKQTLLLYSGAWFYFFSKIVDFLDTIFFVLRKKQNQVTFLHVYHHTTTALFSWGYLKYAPGEQGVIIGIVNSFVHIIMYFYYMVSAMGPKYQKFLWWKKYMTSIQLVQFVLILTYMIIVGAKDCKMPKSLTFFFVVNALIFLFLFGNFYRKTYNKNRKADATNSANISAKPKKHSLLAEGDQMKRLIDVNNNSTAAVKALKGE